MHFVRHALYGIRLVIVLLIALGMHTPVRALESWEHKQLSDLAYHVALKLHCERPDLGAKRPEVCRLRDSDVEREALTLFFDPVNGKFAKGLEGKDVRYLYLSYGTIVACVDYFLTTEKLMAGRENKLITSRDRDARGERLDNAHYEAPQLYPVRRSQLDIDDVHRCGDSLLNLEGMRAAHVNHSHFQADLLMAQRNNHLIALSLNALDKNIFSSLLANAASDHYLQDAFAPGHIISWRNRLTDTVANAQHDLINRKGVLVEFHPGPVGDADFVDRVYASLQEDLARDYFFVPRDDARLKYQHTCRRNCRTASTPADLDSLRAVVTTLKSGKSLQVKVRGDGDVWQRDSDEQRFSCC